MQCNPALLLAQLSTDPFGPSSGPPPEVGAGGIMALLMSCCCPLAIMLVFLVPMLMGMWKTFAKAGQPGWAAFVPIYNIIVMMNIIGQPASRVIFHLIPFVQIYFAIVDTLALVRCFGKDVGFLLGLMFLPVVFWPILGFGSAQYTPPAGAGMGGGGGYSPPPPPPGPRPGGPRPGGPQGGIRPGGPGGAPPRR